MGTGPGGSRRARDLTLEPLMAPLPLSPHWPLARIPWDQVVRLPCPSGLVHPSRPKCQLLRESSPLSCMGAKGALAVRGYSALCHGACPPTCGGRDPGSWTARGGAPQSLLKASLVPGSGRPPVRPQWVPGEMASRLRKPGLCPGHSTCGRCPRGAAGTYSERVWLLFPVAGPRRCVCTRSACGKRSAHVPRPVSPDTLQAPAASPWEGQRAPQSGGPCPASVFR